MTIDYQVLGKAGRDNAVLARVDSGQGIHRLLFDCGDSCLEELSFAEIQQIDDLLFSHFHMDHVGGFDSFFRCNFNRDSKPVCVWGPPGTSEIMSCRFRGFWWNLHQDSPGRWQVNDVYKDRVESFEYAACEAFAQAHEKGSRPTQTTIIDAENFSVDAFAMDHKGPSIAYLVREKARLNIDAKRFSELGLSPGRWLQTLKDDSIEDGFVDVNGQQHSLLELRDKLLIRTPGSSLAYLTDFRLDESAHQRLAEALHGCSVVICESQYQHADLELAQRNYHLTTRQAAKLAEAAEVGELVLFHLSDRYSEEQWKAMLSEASEIFPRVRFPSSWSLAQPE